MNGLIASAKGQAEFYTDPRAVTRAVLIPVLAYAMLATALHRYQRKNS